MNDENESKKNNDGCGGWKIGRPNERPDKGTHNGASSDGGSCEMEKGEALRITKLVNGIALAIGTLTLSDGVVIARGVPMRLFYGIANGRAVVAPMAASVDNPPHPLILNLETVTEATRQIDNIRRMAREELF